MPRRAGFGSILAACVTVAIAVPAAAATSVVKHSSGPLTATLTPPSSHTPKINVNVPGDNQPIEIQAQPGRHALRIQKGGFVAVTRDIEVQTGK